MIELDGPAYNSSEMSAREVLEVLRRRWTLVLGSLVLCVALAVILTPMMTRVYRTRATMLVEQSPMRSTSSQDEGLLQNLLAPTQPYAVDTQVQVLQSGPLLAKVIDRIGPFPPQASPRLNVAQVGQTDIIEVVAESTSPQVAQAAANMLVEEYIRQSDAARGASIHKTRVFVERKLREAQAKLARAEARLRAFKEQYRLPDVNKALASAMVEAASVGEDLRQRENQVTSFRSEIQQLRTQIASEPPQIQAGSTIRPNPMLDTIQDDIQKLELRRISLLRTLKPTEPEIREVDAQVAQLRQKLQQLPHSVTGGTDWEPNPRRATLQGQLDSREVQLHGQEVQIARLRQQYERAQNQLRLFPGWETTFSELNGELVQTQENDKAFSDQLRDLRIQEQAVGVSAHLLTQAGLPGAPVRPQRLLNLLVATALGLILGIGAAYAREMTDDRVYTTMDGVRATGLPVLGRVPLLPRRARAQVSGHGQFWARESYRRLRARVTAAVDGEPVRSLLVTSATSGEGKSTTAANLAVAVALQGRSVILVDADLREPVLSAVFGARPSPGLSDVLLGHTPLVHALTSTDIPHLLLLPAGHPQPHSAELLAGPQLGSLVQQLTQHADLVIFDTPPCVPVADAEVLGTHVDAALLVVGLGCAQKTALRMAQELLDQAHVRLLGAVMNRIRPGDHGYAYRYPAGTGAQPAELYVPLSQEAAAVLPHGARPSEAAATSCEEDPA